MNSILYTHIQIVNTPDLRKQARQSKNFRDYSKTVAKLSKKLPVPVLYVNGTPTTEQIGRLLNDRIVFLVCLYPPNSDITKLAELGKVFSGQPWFLNPNKIKVFQVDGTPPDVEVEEGVEAKFDFIAAQVVAMRKIDELLNTQEGQILAAALPRIVPEGVPDTWATGKVVTKLEGVSANTQAAQDAPEEISPKATTAQVALEGSVTDNMSGIQIKDKSGEEG